MSSGSSPALTTKEETPGLLADTCGAQPGSGQGLKRREQVCPRPPARTPGGWGWHCTRAEGGAPSPARAAEQQQLTQRGLD